GEVRLAILAGQQLPFLPASPRSISRIRPERFLTLFVPVASEHGLRAGPHHPDQVPVDRRQGPPHQVCGPSPAIIPTGSWQTRPASRTCCDRGAVVGKEGGKRMPPSSSPGSPKVKRKAGMAVMAWRPGRACGKITCINGGGQPCTPSKRRL